jgi:hypothetical protein
MSQQNTGNASGDETQGFQLQQLDGVGSSTCNAAAAAADAFPISQQQQTACTKQLAHTSIHVQLTNVLARALMQRYT